MGTRKPAADPATSREYVVPAICALLALAILVVFAQTLRHSFVNFDDDLYVYANRHVLTGLAPDAYAIINADDPRAGSIIKATNAKVMTTGRSERADVRPSGAVRHGINGLSFEASTPAGTISVESPLVGRHNIDNILTAIGVGVGMGFSGHAISKGIRSMRAVSGRMEKVDEGQPYGVVVDYAHTEDALVRLLEAVREIAPKRVITVFGCGGDRDRTKRPKMGAAAVRGSDVVIVTSDNPRTEEPSGIIREVEKGMIAAAKVVKHEPGEALRKGTGQSSASGGIPYMVIPDRREAIAEAIRMAQPGDVVVLAGKGHEDYQVIGDVKIPFDDREVAREEIRKCNAELAPLEIHQNEK